MSRNDESTGGDPGQEGLERYPEALPGLESLYANRRVPAGLEDQVVGSLMEAGWLEGGAPQKGTGGGVRWRTWTIRAAAGLVLFAAGWLTAHAQAAPGDQATGPRYVMLLWEDATFDAAAPPSQVAEEYARWAGEAARRGIPIVGNELALEGRVVVPSSGGAGDPAGGATLGGYFIVEADDPAEARSLAEEHPHVRYGGWIEVAPVMVR